MKTSYVSNIIIPEGEPPTEFLLIKYGITDTTEGPYSLDESGADSVIKIFKKRNLELYFDYDHKSLNPETPEQGKAAGWFGLQKRIDGIWVTDIKWTESAAEYLRNREYRYFSPVLKTRDGGRVYRLVNVALTNLPATDQLEPLMQLQEDTDLEELDSIIRDVTAEVMDNITDTIIENITEKKGEPMKEHLKRIDSTLDHAMGLGQHLNKHMMEVDGEMRPCFEKAHGHMMKMVDLLKEKRAEMDPNGTYQERALKEETSQLSEKVEEVTGHKEFDKQVGTLLALRDAKDSLTKLSEQLKEEVNQAEGKIKALQEKIERTDKEKLVDNYISGPQKKLLLKQRDWALSLNKDQLTAYLEIAPALSLSEKIVEKPVDGEKEVVLHENEIAMISMLEKAGVKISAEEFLKSKKDKGLV